MLASVQAPMYEDLGFSGLIPDDMHCRWIDSPERGATNTAHSVQGYVIPYRTFHGKPLPFYRVRLFNSTPKYKQTKESSNYVYYPRGFEQVAKDCPYIILTEGEKKAALACKMGFAAVALSGVDSWRNRTVVLPADTELKAGAKDTLKAKIPSQEEITEDISSNLAVGMQELIDYAMQHQKHVIIVFDSDNDVGIKAPVQRAAATLGFDLRFRGIDFNHIRQIVLPPLDLTTSTAVEEVKVGLDDFLMKKGKEEFQALIDVCLKKRSAFPRHPSIRDFLNKKLQKMNLSRKDTQAVAIGILSDLDANGIRLLSTAEDQTYYFDFVTRKLIKTTFDSRQDDVSGTPFGQFLYRRYGISGADKRLIIWLAAQFTGEDPIEEVSPHRIIARVKTSDDCVYYQVSDSQYVQVNAHGIELFDNGENGILFESGQVVPLDTEKLLQNYAEMETNKSSCSNLWADVLSDVRLRDQNQQRQITALLYYMSPWLYRWRGMQLPVEMVIGESGSGKSTLCELRLNILEGDARLRNAPQDLKDWHASIANTGGLHVTDNVQLVDRNLRQRLSDELCRIITEPNPHIEMRRYYTNADLMRIPIRAVFALTAIQQPFQNADLLQRAIILELDKTSSLGDGKSAGITYDAEWRNNQLHRFGGREGWIAHHLFVMHRFFKLVRAKWDAKYQAKHRLINFEQAMILMAEVFGQDGKWIPSYLAGTVEKSLSESDWTFEGIKAFCEAMRPHVKGRTVSAQNIGEWAASQEDFMQCEMLTNTRKLGRYLQTHRSMVHTICGLVAAGTQANRQVFKLEKPQIR